MGFTRGCSSVAISAQDRASKVATRQDARIMHLAARTDRLPEEAAAAQAKREWEEASDLARAAREQASLIQLALVKEVSVAHLLELACPTAKNIAHGMAKISETPFWKNRKHKQQKEAGMAVSMDGEDLILTSADADAEKANRAWNETNALAALTRENADRMKRRVEEAVNLAKDLEAKSVKAEAIAQRAAHIAETARFKKRKHEEEEEDRKKRMATMQEEARKQNNEEARKYRRVAPSRKSSSTDGNEQQQPQERLQPHPPRYPPPGRTVSAGWS